jgi:hypothetical protein
LGHCSTFFCAIPFAIFIAQLAAGTVRTVTRNYFVAEPQSTTYQFKEMAMKEHEMKVAARVRVDGLGEIARQGVERALAARNGAVVLSEAQAEQVGGGAIAIKALSPIVAGGILGPIDIFGTRPGGGEVGVPTTLGGAATLGA